MLPESSRNNQRLSFVQPSLLAFLREDRKLTQNSESNNAAAAVQRPSRVLVRRATRSRAN
jgi:hypothetical protein